MLQALVYWPNGDAQTLDGEEIGDLLERIAAFVVCERDGVPERSLTETLRLGGIRSITFSEKGMVKYVVNIN